MLESYLIDLLGPVLTVILIDFFIMFISIGMTFMVITLIDWMGDK